MAGMLFLWSINLFALLYIISSVIIKLPLIVLIAPLFVSAGVAITYIILQLFKKMWEFLDGKDNNAE